MKCKKRVKSLSIIDYAAWHEGVQGSGGITPPLLTFALVGGEWSVSCSATFAPAPVG
jgi:hypothetical protein